MEKEGLVKLIAKHAFMLIVTCFFVTTLVINLLYYWTAIPFMGIFFVVLGIYVIAIALYYFYNSRGYYNNLGRIRRFWYVLFIYLLFLGYIFSVVDIENWQLVLQLAAIILFVDLAIFQNPNILKFWNAEFQYDDHLRESLKDLEDEAIKIEKKIESFSTLVSKSFNYFQSNDFGKELGFETYKKELAQFLSEYTKVYEHKLAFFELHIDRFQGEDEETVINLEEVVDMISQRHAIRWEKNENFDQESFAAESIDRNSNFSIINKKLLAIPYYGLYHQFVLTLHSEDSEVTLIDASNIANLIYVFDFLVLSSYMEQH
ncbi:type II toxin-antitoxin system SpoIISA family toxin [Jeotgalibacillus proteolyticus]|uniref:Sporulation protein SpoIISA n=1 Tax=Jeotgalibacillus proteolyticus TaxID=2082395 RepID=A0A2S5G9J4_9BACL|nr:type II toxin-antitoxin system SpoIISA family toxin [Jeotgalibacillus proteolyticus]PPA69672.1 hypothetical protein C4B60_14105 [Jeotgalibacillus proteolyticus]